MKSPLLNELMQISKYVGSKIPLWNQGFGGNISVKDGDALYIKSTGKRLQDLSQKSDLAYVNWRQLSKVTDTLSENDYKELIYTCSVQNEGWGRPSMETGLHSLSTKKWVIHFHSVPMVLLSELYVQDKKNEIEENFKSHGLIVDFIPKKKPGLSLMGEFSSINPLSDVILIQSHGVVLRSDDREIIYKYEQVEQELIKHFNWDLTVDLTPTSPLEAFFPDTAVYWSDFVKLAIPVGKDLFKLQEEAPLHLKEIWEAQSIIFKNNSRMTAFSPEEISIISNLPTEQLRKK